jgi:hypothetical protein
MNPIGSPLGGGKLIKRRKKILDVKRNLYMMNRME